MHFADLLVKEVNILKDRILNMIQEPEERCELYRQLLSGRWLPLPPEKIPTKSKVYAIDSSDGVIELAGGGVIYVVRAAALSNKRGNEAIRKLKLDAFYPPSDEKLDEYRRLMREHLEHLTALEATRNLGQEDFILIDGSIFGRMNHVFQVLDIPDKEDFMSTYVETFYNLLDTCMKKNITLIGVAKDSRSSLLRKSLLAELLLKEIRNYESELQLEIMTILRYIQRSPRQAFRAIQEIVNKVDKDIYIILQELLDNTPDYKMIMASRMEPGYSNPLKLELRNVASGFVEILFTPSRRDELVRTFVASLPQNKVSTDTEKRIYKALEHMTTYPAVAALYARFAKNDIPLRIDIVHPDIEKWSLEECDPSGKYVNFASDGWEGVVYRVLGLLRGLYAGLKNYNVLLTSVDKYVKMTQNIKNLYKAKIESILDTLIQQSRGVRRVSFP